MELSVGVIISLILASIGLTLFIMLCCTNFYIYMYTKYKTGGRGNTDVNIEEMLSNMNDISDQLIEIIDTVSDIDF